MIVAGAFAAVLAVGLGRAQASKLKAPEPSMSQAAASATQSVQAGLAPTRTATGRPADLDPRIPWLEDLGIPQSGGPEPLVKVASCAQPLPGAVVDLFDLDGDLVMQVNGVDRVVLKASCEGKVLWSHLLREGVGWRVVTDGRRIYCVPLTIPEDTNVREPILAYDGDGKLAGRIEWPIPRGEGAGAIVLKDGCIIGEAMSGRRIHVRTDPTSTVDPEVIVTVRDVMAGGEGVSKEEHHRLWREGKVALGIRKKEVPGDPVKARGISNRRLRAAKPWVGRILRVRDLPGFDSKDRSAGDWWKPGFAIGSVVRLEKDGNVWIMASLLNPHHLSASEMLRKDRPVEKDRNVLACFDVQGKLRGYVIEPRENMGFFSVDEALYLWLGDRLERWECRGR